jgi:hypothetical protein
MRQLFARPEDDVQEVVPLVDDVLMSDVLKGKVAGVEEDERKAEALAARIIVASVELVLKDAGRLPLVGGVRGMKSTSKSLVLELRANLSDAYTVVELHARGLRIEVASVRTTQGEQVSDIYAEEVRANYVVRRHVAAAWMCDVEHERDSCTLLIDIRA